MMKKKLMIYLFLGVGLMGLFLFTPDMVYAAGSGVTETVPSSRHHYRSTPLRSRIRASLYSKECWLIQASF